MLFTGLETNGTASLYYVDKGGFREVVESYRYMESHNHISTIAKIGSGSKFVDDSISKENKDLMLAGGEKPRVYCDIMINTLRSCALNDDNTGGFGTVSYVKNKEILQFNRETLHDFNSWTRMIEEAEKNAEGLQDSKKLMKLRTVYDNFLREFPLCHDYWKKYADHVYRLTSKDKVAEALSVYVRALKYLKHSVDFWMDYCQFVMSNTDPNTVKWLFDEAVGYVGNDHLSKPLWDLKARLKELPGMRSSVIKTGEQMYQNPKEVDPKIIRFETAIRRRHFDVRDLESSDLNNWHNYLDFMEAQLDSDKVVKLYERCLIPCANYPEFWVRYISSMEDKGRTDLADDALFRATRVFLKRCPEIHLFSARFSEQRGNIKEARAAYKLAHSENSSARLEALVRHANMECREGYQQNACALYQNAVLTEGMKRNSQILHTLVIMHARFLWLVVRVVDEARNYLVWFLKKDPSKSVLEFLIFMESAQLGQKDILYLDSLVEKYVVPGPDNSATTTDRETISSKFLEFLDSFGDIKSIKKAADRHVKLFSRHRHSTVLGKRSAEDCLASDKKKLAKSYGGSSPPAPYPAVQT